MKNQFTYIDFLMYVVPGAFLLSVLVFASFLLTPDFAFPFKADIFSSIIFLISSFILGNLIQNHSHGRPETRLKKKFWGGFYPSEIIFFSGNGIVDEHERERLIAACLKKDLLSSADTQILSKRENCTHELVGKYQTVFNSIRTYLNSEEGRILGAEGYYLFFRGMFVVSFWAGIILLSVSVINGFIQNSDPFVLYPLIAAITCFYMWYSFRNRCRGAAQGFAKYVCRAFHVKTLISD